MGNENNMEENNNINEDEIIENDCYEEINLKNINKIIQEEKLWNKNSIIYNINDKDILNINEENKNEQNQNNNEKEKTDEDYFNQITKKNIINDICDNNKENKQKEENKNILNENIKNITNENNRDLNKINNDNQKENNNTIDNKVINDENENNENQNNKTKIKPTNTGNGIFDKKRKSQKITDIGNIHNNLNNHQLNNNNGINNFFNINNIVSEYRLNHLKENEIIYSGTLQKILKIPEKNTITYSERFCLLTKNYFAYYKSKESYISLNKPLLLLNNKNIIRIENTCFVDNTYYFGIICEVNDETKKYINRVNSFVTKENNISELLLGFRTKEIEDMIKWVVVLTYFTTR